MENWVKWIIICSAIIVVFLIIFVIAALIVGSKNTVKKQEPKKQVDTLKSGTEVFYYNDGDDYLFDNVEV